MTEERDPKVLSASESLELSREIEAQNRATFERAKQEALDSGKEEFDLDKFDELYSAPNAPFERSLERDRRLDRWEHEYYAGVGDKTSTIAEYAELRQHLDDNWS